MHLFQPGRLLTVLTLLLGSLTLPSPAPATSADQVASRPAHRASSSTGTGLLTLDWGDIDSTPEPWRGDYLVLQPWEGERIAELKQRNPDLRVLMYKDMSATVREAHESGVFPTGVGYSWVAAHHPEWFLHDAAGRRVEWSDWAGLYPMDVGSRSYQDVWADTVIAELKAHDWDGVMMDDALTYLSHDTAGGVTPVEIPTDAAMYDATESFLARVGARVKDAGLLAVPNVTIEWNTWRDVLEDWTRYVSGWENEYFVKWGLSDDVGRFSGADWKWKMQMAAWCAARRVPLLAITYSTKSDRVSQTFHRATWLLAWNGRTGASIFVPEESWTDHWTPAANVDLGRPDGRRQRLANGIFQRRYTGGVVLVNPTEQSQVVALERTYRTRAGRRVDQVTLAPTTAALLTR